LRIGELLEFLVGMSWIMNKATQRILA
jgi:hypothetical protein